MGAQAMLAGEAKIVDRRRHGEHDPTRRILLTSHAAATKYGHDKIVRSHGARWPRRRLRRQADGRLCRHDRAANTSSPAKHRTPTRSRRCAARTGGDAEGRIQARDRAGRRSKGSDRSATDELPRKARPDKIPSAEARLHEGRHGDGGERLGDLRRCGGARADEAVGSEKARAQADGDASSLRRCARAGAAHISPPRRCPRSRRRSARRAGRRTTSISGRSTKRSPSCR